MTTKGLTIIVIGVDVHKRTHTLVAIDRQTGRQLHQHTVQATDAGHLEALRFAHDLQDDELIWAIEDCRLISQRLEQALLSVGEHVLRVPPTMTAAGRKTEREPGKSDPIDALAVARAVLSEGVERFPVAFLDAQSMEIRLLHDHREQLIRERTRTQNRLHFHIFSLDPELERSLTPRSLDHPRVLARIRRRLHQLPAGAQTRVALSELTHIIALTREINELFAELDRLTLAQHPALRAETSCSPVTAAILIGQTAGARRFATDAQFARQAGVAPIQASSGNTRRHRLHRSGNRQLNKALQIIALSRARIDPRTWAYLQGQRDNGKSTREAMRSLKRYLARHIWRLLCNAAADPPTAPNARRLRSAPPLSCPAPKPANSDLDLT